MVTPRRSSGCGACIPELTTRRHRGRSQAPWTIVMQLVRKPSQSIHTSTETYTFRRRSRMPCVFSWPPLLVGDTVEVVSSSATSSSTEFASTSLYSIYIRSCPQQTVCSTHTHTSTKLNCLQYYYYSCTAVCTCLNIVVLIEIMGQYITRLPRTTSCTEPARGSWGTVWRIMTVRPTGWSVQVFYVAAFCLRMIRTGSRFSLICGA